MGSRADSPTVLVLTSDAAARDWLIAEVGAKHAVCDAMRADEALLLLGRETTIAVVICDLACLGTIAGPFLEQCAALAPQARLVLLGDPGSRPVGLACLRPGDVLLQLPCSATEVHAAVDGVLDGAARAAIAPFHEVLPRLATTIELEQSIVCLHVDCSHLLRLESELGESWRDELVDRVADMLRRFAGDLLAAGDTICRDDEGGFLIFLAPRDPDEDAQEIAFRLQLALDSALLPEAKKLQDGLPRVAVGASRALAIGGVRPVQPIVRAVDRARTAARRVLEQARHMDRELLVDAIVDGRLRFVYQPIVHLESGDVFGFEALVRGPAATPFESPGSLFALAEDAGLLAELDRACLRGAVQGAAALNPVHRLFLNHVQRAFLDPTHRGEILGLLGSLSLSPANVVFEITEQQAIADTDRFCQALAPYVELGFGVAIDDLGSRHSNFEAVVALRPHTLKLSTVFTRGIATSLVRREMLRSLVRIARTIDATLVAEGIEDVDDLSVLVDLGVRYGQGYFLARPGAAFPTVRYTARRALAALASGTLPKIVEPPEREFDDATGEFRTRRGYTVARQPDARVLDRTRPSRFAEGTREVAIEAAEAAGNVTAPRRSVTVPGIGVDDQIARSRPAQ